MYRFAATPSFPDVQDCPDRHDYAGRERRKMDGVNSIPVGHVLPALHYLDFGKGRYVPRIDGYRCAHCGRVYLEQFHSLVKHLRAKHGIHIASGELT